MHTKVVYLEHSRTRKEDAKNLAPHAMLIMTAGATLRRSLMNRLAEVESMDRDRGCYAL